MTRHTPPSRPSPIPPTIPAADDFGPAPTCATCVFHEAVRFQTTGGWTFLRRCNQPASPHNQFATPAEMTCAAHRPARTAC